MALDSSRILLVDFGFSRFLVMQEYILGQVRVSLIQLVLLIQTCHCEHAELFVVQLVAVVFVKVFENIPGCLFADVEHERKRVKFQARYCVASVHINQFEASPRMMPEKLLLLSIFAGNENARDEVELVELDGPVGVHIKDVKDLVGLGLGHVGGPEHKSHKGKVVKVSLVFNIEHAKELVDKFHRAGGKQELARVQVQDVEQLAGDPHAAWRGRNETGGRWRKKS
mmetsp:Transcript_785/g.2354  ORF Transcript_785/g.2354 Transcript_785/m.2354 type:complete len:226 (-) Transcript_785:33-710(-)